MRSVLVLVFLVLGSVGGSAEEPPVSVTMREATRLYDEEQFARAEPLLLEVHRGLTPDPPLARQRAEFFLGKASFNLRRYRDARGYFLHIAGKGPAHVYYQRTLLWLAALQQHLSGDGELMQAILGYDRSVLDQPGFADVRDTVLLLRGKLLYRQRRFADAAAELGAIDGRSQEMVPGLLWQGMSQLCAGDQHQATAAFHGVLRRAPGGRFQCDPLAFKELRGLFRSDADAMQGADEMAELVIHGGDGAPVLLRRLCP